MFEEWFQAYRQVKEANGITDEFEWNADESGFRVGVLRGHVVWTYVDIDKPVQTDPDTRSLVTVVEAISAAGKTIPPFVILPGVNISAKMVRNNLDDGTSLNTSPNGYMDDQIALDWLQHFDRHTKPGDNNEGQKRLLLLDNHGSHLTFEFYDLAAAMNVVLFPLPPSTTHKLQPLDVGIFQTYKQYHQRHIQHMVEVGVLDYDKPEFLQGLKKIRDQTMKPRTIKSAWAASGLVPFDPRIVLDALEDPLTSALNPEAIVTKPGYIVPPPPRQPNDEVRFIVPGEVEDEEEEGEEEKEDFDPPVLPTPDQLKYIDWSQVTTPPLDLAILKEYSDYIDTRVASSIATNIPLTPTLKKVIDKRNKAAQALLLFGAHAAEDSRRQRRRELEREASRSNNRLLMKFGPITAGDGRLRSATDENNRQALKNTEAERIATREHKSETASLHRWLRAFKTSQTKELARQKAKLRAEGMRLAQATQYIRPKLDRLNDCEWLVARYREERHRRHEIYHRAVREKHQQLAMEAGRPMEDIPTPWDVSMESLKPVTPWHWSPMVDEVIQEFMMSGGASGGEDSDTDDDFEVE